jgi:multicomponent Na+:H+ antiporter subunit B
MYFLILKLAVKHLKPVMLVFSVFILLRGHSYPGGGFIAGLMAGSALVLDGISNDVSEIQQRMVLKPRLLIAIGLLCVFLSGSIGLLISNTLLLGIWMNFKLPWLGSIKIGTPLLFDVGVYFVVTGILVMIMFSIVEELEWK